MARALAGLDVDERLAGIPIMHQAFTARWRAMNLDEQRHLARALLDVRIYPANVAGKIGLGTDDDGNTTPVVI